MLKCFIGLFVSFFIVHEAISCNLASKYAYGNGLYMITHDNRLLVLPQNATEMEEFEALAGHKIVRIFAYRRLSSSSTSSTHFAIDDQGKVWAWGENGVGQLGLCDCSPLAIIPHLESVAGVLPGNCKTFAWDINGKLWVFGKIERLMLPTFWESTKEQHWLPPTEFPFHLPVEKVIKSDFSLIILDKNGGVWGVGYNSYAQLGIEGQINEPTQIPINRRIVNVVMTDDTTYFQDSNNNILFCGGLGNAPIQPFFNLKAKVIACDNNKFVAGHNTKFAALAADGCLVIWGDFKEENSDKIQKFQVPCRIEKVRACDLFILNGEVYFLTPERQIKLYKHKHIDPIEENSSLVIGPLSLVKRAKQE